MELNVDIWQYIIKYFLSWCFSYAELGKQLITIFTWGLHEGYDKIFCDCSRRQYLQEFYGDQKIWHIFTKEIFILRLVCKKLKYYVDTSDIWKHHYILFHLPIGNRIATCTHL